MSNFAKLFAKYLAKAVKHDRTINSLVAKADKDLENGRKSIENYAGGDKERVKKALPPNVRKALGMDY